MPASEGGNREGQSACPRQGAAFSGRRTLQSRAAAQPALQLFTAFDAPPSSAFEDAAGEGRRASRRCLWFGLATAAAAGGGARRATFSSASGHGPCRAHVVMASDQAVRAPHVLCEIHQAVPALRLTRLDAGEQVAHPHHGLGSPNDHWNTYPCSNQRRRGQRGAGRGRRKAACKRRPLRPARAEKARTGRGQEGRPLACLQ